MNSYRTAKHIKTVDAAGHFIPPGRWNGDRYPCTLQEAFGEGARLDLGDDRRDKIQVACGTVLIVLAIAVAAVVIKLYA